MCVKRLALDNSMREVLLIPLLHTWIHTEGECYFSKEVPNKAPTHVFVHNILFIGIKASHCWIYPFPIFKVFAKNIIIWQCCYDLHWLIFVCVICWVSMNHFPQFHLSHGKSLLFNLERDRLGEQCFHIHTSSKSSNWYLTQLHRVITSSFWKQHRSNKNTTRKNTERVQTWSWQTTTIYHLPQFVI